MLDLLQLGSDLMREILCQSCRVWKGLVWVAFHLAEAKS
jgi:hypothetical protein